MVQVLTVTGAASDDCERFPEEGGAVAAGGGRSARVERFEEEVGPQFRNRFVKMFFSIFLKILFFSNTHNDNAL
jgi:hypothetical protein